MNLSTAAAALTDASSARTPSPPPSPAAAGPTDMLDVMFSACSEAVWETEELRPMQQKIIRLMIDPSSPNAVLAVYRTGGGKSHIIRMIGVLDRGVCLIFIPLLLLSADVMAKFQSAMQHYGSVRAYHLDEIFDNDRELYDSVLQRCNDLPPSTPSTVFAFLSPQHLCHSQDALNTFLACGARGTLRTVVMDEIHLHVAHGLSFREECRQLKDVFFVPLFHPIDKDQFMPRLLCLTATMPIDYYEGLEYLTATDFRANQESIQRGDYEDFLQMNISMKQMIVTKNDFVKVGLSFVAKHLSDDPGCKVVIFCNSRAKSVHYASELERKLSEIGNETDVIVIHGGLNKHEKFWRIRFFCGIDGEYVNETCFGVLVSTNASNVGIDHRLINLVIRFELPRDLMTYLQERGRAGRLGTLALCILYATIESYANIIRQIYSSNQQEDERDASIEELELRGMGSAISPLAQSARRELEQRRQATVRRANPYALSLEMKRKLKKRQHQELRDVLRFFFLNKGCQHYRGAFYQSMGVLDGTDVVEMCRACESCDCCSVCDGSWDKMHLPIFRSQLVRFLESSSGRYVFPMEYSAKTPLSTVLSKRVYWTEWIFDRAKSGIQVRNIDALFLSLIAADIITLEKNRSGVWQWNLVWVDNSTPKYTIDEVWDGINLIEEGTTRNRTVTVRE